MKNTFKATSMIAVIYLFTGYQELSAQAKKDSLKEKQIDEVVMIGYGTAKKRDLTGSISKIGGDVVADKPASNAINSLQGKVAGLTVVASGELNKAPDVRIRGTSSLYNSKPYYVIDGLLLDNMDFVNPNDIESIEVLKDPSSLAIFGVRGANGIIIVTTKQGKKGKVSVAFNSTIGAKNITGKPRLTDAAGFKTLFNEQLANDGLAPYQFYNFYNGNTDWIDQIKRDNAFLNNNNISISSGNDFNKINFSLGYSTEEGLIKNEEYKRLTVNINDELNITKNIKVGVSANAIKADLPQTHNFEAALIATPILEPISSNGLYNQLPPDLGDAQIGNPLAYVDVIKNRTQINTQYKVVGNVFAELKFLKDFTFRVSYTGSFDDIKNREYSPVLDLYIPYSEKRAIYNNGNNGLTNVIESNTNNKSLLQDYLLTWNKKIGEHSITATIGNSYTYTKHTFNGVQGFQKSGDLAVPNDPRFWYTSANPYIDPTTIKLVLGPTIKSNTGIGDIVDKWNYLPWENALNSYLFRVLYNYKGKYLLNASFRRDGSSELSLENRYQNFWALGAGWEVTRESFMKNQKIFDYLKLKGSYGELGNLAAPLHNLSKPYYVPGAAGVFGNPQGVKNAYIIGYISDNLKWEKVNSYEAGLEFEVLNRRLRFEALYYNKITKDLLLSLDAATLGIRTFQNSGEIENKGFEFVSSWKDKIGEDFSYSLGANVTTIKNNVNSIYQDGFRYFDGVSITQAESPIGSFYGYVVEGVYQTYADIAASPKSTLGKYRPGDLKFKDINGDGKIDENDRTIIGNPTPDLTYGFSVGMNYKNLYLDVDVQGVYGNEVWRGWGNGASYTNFNFREDQLNRWHGQGTSNWEPQVSNTSYNRLPSTYMIEDGSYVRLRNIQLGYKFNQSILESVGIKSMKLFINIQNLHTWKWNSGFTPEAGGSPTSFGIDNGGYPMPAISTLGFNLTF